MIDTSAIVFQNPLAFQNLPALENLPAFQNPNVSNHLGTLDLRDYDIHWQFTVRIATQSENIKESDLRDRLKRIGEHSFVGVVEGKQGLIGYRDLIVSNLPILPKAQELTLGEQLRRKFSSMLGVKERSSFNFNSSKIDTVTTLAIALDEDGRVSLSTSPQKTVGYCTRARIAGLDLQDLERSSSRFTGSFEMNEVFFPRNREEAQELHNVTASQLQSERSPSGAMNALRSAALHKEIYTFRLD